MNIKFHLNKINNGYCILTETSLYLNMLQFVLAVFFVIKSITDNTKNTVTEK